MNILSITAGAAGMYCGSCFRDNALAAELTAAGHDVTLLPVYTPTLIDEPNVSVPKCSVRRYQRLPAALVVRSSAGLPASSTACSILRGVISTFARGGGTTDPALLGELTISTLDGRDGVLRREFEKLVDWIRSQPTPDVINIPNSLLISHGGTAAGRPGAARLLHAAGRRAVPGRAPAGVSQPCAGRHPPAGADGRSLPRRQRVLRRPS